MYMMCIIHSLKSVHTYMYVMILHVVLGCVELIYNIVYSLINTCSRVSYRREGISPPNYLPYMYIDFRPNIFQHAPTSLLKAFYGPRIHQRPEF